MVANHAEQFYDTRHEGDMAVPPIGEVFRPKTALTPEQQIQTSVIEAMRVELGTVLQTIAPEGQRTWQISDGLVLRSAMATYAHPDLPSSQLMCAWVERTIWRGSQPDNFELVARLIDAQTGEHAPSSSTDTKAWLGEDGKLINGYANREAVTLEQQLEAYEEVAETLELIATAVRARTPAIHR